MKKLTIEGYPCSILAALEPVGTDREIAQALLAHNLRLIENLPDSARVTLSEMTFEKFVPPRCRKPRERRVTTPLGEFRQQEVSP
jgi:hypothetical protein